jgi:hypothetical protein
MAPPARHAAAQRKTNAYIRHNPILNRDFIGMKRGAGTQEKKIKNLLRFALTAMRPPHTSRASLETATLIDIVK